MINRELIRLKILQLVYAYYQNEGKTVEMILQELDFSMNKGYELYQYMLSLLVEIHNYCANKNEVYRLQERTETKDLLSLGQIANNQFLLQLSSNITLLEYQNKVKKKWQEEEAQVKRLANLFVESEIFTNYLQVGDFSYEADREVIRKLYKSYINAKDELDGMLEEHSLYWNHDKDIVDSFVLKTIKRFDSANGAEQELLPQYADKEDRLFAQQLLTQTIRRGEEVRQYIRQNCKNWEFSRLAFMDVVIMQIAMAEILSFPEIPLAVSLNEYLNLAKMYSTPRSSAYINGLLDFICKTLRKEGKLLKERH